MAVLQRYILVLISTLAVLASSQRLPIVGVTTGIDRSTGARPARLEINSFATAGGPAWDLYILGLADFQNAPETDLKSYYQFEGIHGRPFKPWNGVNAVNKGSGGGYCPHGEIIFTSWHRAYVAGYEQFVIERAQAVAKQYTGSEAAAYIAAANTLRIPYWDWAVDSNTPPAASTPTITVNGPQGPTTIRNPLYSYRFQQFPLNSGDWPANTICSVFPETKRAPDGNGNNQIGTVNAILAQDGLRAAVYQTFTNTRTFEEMASMSSSGYSFENPHNNVHNAFLGTLAAPDCSAFDPLFMLHHVNVDRYIALWQAIHPNMTFTSSYTSGGLFATAKGAVIDVNSPLKPFFRDNQNYHTSITALSMKPFGYTYPEIDDWSQSSDATSKAVIAKVNALYSNSGANFRRRGADFSIRKDYSVNLQVERSQLPLPANIEVWVGDQLAGKMALLSMPSEGLAYARVPLTQALQSKNIATLSIEATIPLLENEFRVEIKPLNGPAIPLKSVSSLKVEVVDEDVVPPNSIDELPTYGEQTKHPSVWKQSAKVVA